MITIRWIGQSGYLLSDGEITICLDPYLSDIVNRVANRPRMVKAPFLPQSLKADIVICTHNHLDHTDIDAIPLMQKENITFLAPSDCEETLRRLGIINYTLFDEGTKKQYGGFKLKAVYAKHSIPAVGVLVEHKNMSLYFTGDTEYSDRLASVKCDCLFVCINGRLGNMNVQDAIKLTQKINPRIAIPNHYGMFESNTEDPKKFEVPQRFIMKYDKIYTLDEMMGGI